VGARIEGARTEGEIKSNFKSGPSFVKANRPLSGGSDRSWGQERPETPAKREEALKRILVVPKRKKKTTSVLKVRENWRGRRVRAWAKRGLTFKK